MTSMKVSELTGDLLDYWVAKAEGHEVDPPLQPGQEWPSRESFGRKYEPNYIAFSTDWAAGGPIIERERIHLFTFKAPTRTTNRGDLGAGDEPCIGWAAHNEAWKPDAIAGPSPLIAAMRAYVASKYGEEVQDL
jgi:hypothetical protein